jgi:uncharacterized metal-binding protein YceD (DUF177 family)
VEDIPAAGQQVAVGLEASWARDAVFEALDTPPTDLSASFALALGEREGHVDVRLAVETAAPGVCDRCGEDLQMHLAFESDLRYCPEETGASTGRPDEEIELGEDDLDVGWYRDGHLSLSDVLREAVALALPSRIVCEDVAACDARTRSMLEANSEEAGGHPAFAALKNLTNNSE